jgi:subfamily B ATP-binding cassette protein MsbA
MIDFILGKDIATYVREQRGLVVLALALTAISTLFVVIPAYLLQPFVDEGMKTGSDPVSWKIPWIAFNSGSWLSWSRTELVLVKNISPNLLLILLTFIAFLSVLLKSITIYISGLVAAALSNRTVRSLRIDLFAKFVALPLGFHQKRRSGELIARATADLGVMQGLISSILIGLVEHPLTAAVFLCYLFIMNYKLTLTVFIVAPLIVGVVRLFGRKVKKHATRVQDATADVTSAYQETLMCLKVVLGFFRGNREVKKFGKLADELYRKTMRWYRWHLGLGPMMDSMVFLVLPAVLIVGKLHFQHTLGELVSMIYAFAGVYRPIKKLAMVNNQLRTLQGSTNRVFSIMGTAPEIQDLPSAKILPRHREYLEFKDVSFGYTPDDLILKDVSFKVMAGEMVAFVGSTGAGKSTLLDLIPRFYDIDRGSITIDGIDLREVTLESIRRQIGIVSQEIVLFHDSIANNIAYGASERSMEEIIAAAKSAHAHDFIMAQPKGYETIVGDRGTLLSGGQRQRIAIARALLVDPAILILDEAASALDSESEKFIQMAIERLRGGLTILVVAHRLSTIMKADRIYVLEGAKVVESGSREELMALDGRFRKFYDMQFES